MGTAFEPASGTGSELVTNHHVANVESLFQSAGIFRSFDVCDVRGIGPCVRGQLVLTPSDFTWFDLATFVYVCSFAMPPTVRASVEEAAKTQEELSTVIAELKQTLRNRRRREAYAVQIPKQVEAAARLLLCRSGGDLQLLGKFLAYKTGRSSEHLQSWAAKLMAWYGECSEKEASSSGGGASGAHGGRASKLLDSFMQEQSLHSWVEEQNVRHGIYPCTGVMLDQLAHQNLNGTAKGNASEPRKYRSSLQYLRRWRHRWGVGRSSVQPLETLPVEVMRKKVA